MKHYESLEQQAVVRWARLSVKEYPCLKWLHSSLSGVKVRSIKEGARLKMEGNVAGIADLFLPYPIIKECRNLCGANRIIYAGLYIEMKRKAIGNTQKGVLSQAQKDFLAYANEVGYKAIVCYGADEAISAIKEYLN